MRTPVEKISTLSEYTGYVRKISGGMNGWFSVHFVMGIILGLASFNLDMPKSVTLARVPAIRTLLLDKFPWTISFRWR